ncbi:MAG: cytochrome c biogenesis protein CcsA, partial [Candidatus Heimdallarchaeota archaeon]|nr:cytochrome c biogenesis protein CcsA [Candidatus Heimdallarchaeota archaeon]
AFLSYSAFIVPYAIGLAGLSLNMKGSDISDRNRWLIDFFMIVGWVLTTLFLVAGSIWAYEVDWGGYWQWDPVQVSSIVLWLMATLYFHIKPMMGKEYSIHFFSAALGWVGVTFAAFIVRGGLIEGPHQYIGTAQFIVFGLLLLGTVVALAFASMKSDFEIIPDWFFSPSMVKNKKSLYTIWILVTAIIFNVTCITLQIIYAQMGTILTNLSPLYGTMNGIFLLAIAFILILYESDVLGISKQKFTYFIIGSFLISLIWALISISNYNRIGFIFFILFSTCFFTQLLNLMSPIIIKANSKNTYLRLMHFVILFTLLMYASTDPNTESVEVDITMNQSLVIDSFDAIVSLKEVNNGTYATVILEITNLKGNNPNEVLLQQGIYKTSIWIKGDWISYSTHDLFFKFNGIQNLLFSTKLNTISLIIKYVPNSFLFKINFNLMLIVGIIGIHKKLKERAK